MTRSRQDHLHVRTRIVEEPAWIVRHLGGATCGGDTAPTAGAALTHPIAGRARPPAQPVHIRVTGSEVTPTDGVPRLQERREAGYAVWFSRGVTQVDDQLVVTP